MKVNDFLSPFFYVHKSQLILTKLSRVFKRIFEIARSVFMQKVNTQTKSTKANGLKHKKMKKLEKRLSSPPKKKISIQKKESNKESIHQSVSQHEEQKQTSYKKEKNTISVEKSERFSLEIENSESLQSKLNETLKKEKNTISVEKTESFSLEIENLESLQSKLNETLEYSKGVCIYGSSNKKADREKTGNYVQKAFNDTRYHRQGNRISPDEIVQVQYNETDIVRNENAARYKNLSKDKELKNLFGRVVQPHETGAGNCGEQSDIAFYYLWKNEFPEVAKIERISFRHLDHVCVVVNRRNDSSISDPSSWNGWVIDPWADEVFHSDEFLPKGRTIARQLKEEEEAINRYKHYDPETVPLDVRVDTCWTPGFPKAPDVFFFRVKRQ